MKPNPTTVTAQQSAQQPMSASESMGWLLGLVRAACDVEVAHFEPRGHALRPQTDTQPGLRLEPADRDDIRELSELTLALNAQSFQAPSIRGARQFRGTTAAGRSRRFRHFSSWRVDVDGNRELSGQLCLYSSESRLLTPDQTRQARHAAQLAASWLGTMSDATTDDLTDTLERGHGAELLEKDLARSIRTLKPFVIAMIDLDHFKQLNDSSGHHTGDEALQLTARLLREVYKRASDGVVRWGGEEFLVFHPETQPNEGTERLESFMLKLAQAKFAHPHGIDGRLTASAGVVRFQPSPQDFRSGDMKAKAETLVRQADQAMYRAKRDGRNRFCVGSTLERPETTNASA